MTLQEIYAIAKQVKPEFDSKITKIADEENGIALLPELKTLARAQSKIQYEHNGDPAKIRDILRASIIVSTAAQVNNSVRLVSDDFLVMASRNGYSKKTHSSDGYFDAKIDVEFMGIYAEIQIHTQAMLDAKEMAHELFEQRQKIQRSVIKGHRPTSGQISKINELNKQMRELFRKAANNE